MATPHITCSTLAASNVGSTLLLLLLATYGDVCRPSLGVCGDESLTHTHIVQHYTHLPLWNGWPLWLCVSFGQQGRGWKTFVRDGEMQKEGGGREGPTQPRAWRNLCITFVTAAAALALWGPERLSHDLSTAFGVEIVVGCILSLSLRLSHTNADLVLFVAARGSLFVLTEHPPQLMSHVRSHPIHQYIALHVWRWVCF